MNDICIINTLFIFILHKNKNINIHLFRRANVNMQMHNHKLLGVRNTVAQTHILCVKTIC